MMRRCGIVVRYPGGGPLEQVRKSGYLEKQGRIAGMTNKVFDSLLVIVYLVMMSLTATAAYAEDVITAKNPETVLNIV